MKFCLLVTMLMLNVSLALAETPLQKIAFGSCAKQFKLANSFFEAVNNLMNSDETIKDWHVSD
jgi:hypothetical protein